MAVVGTLAALVLSLMITNASSSFNAKSDAIASLAVEVVKLDRTLRRYGPATAPARAALRAYEETKAADSARTSAGLGVSTLEHLERVDDDILALSPNGERQTHLKGDALSLIHAIADSRWVLVAKTENTVSSPFLGLLIFWLALLFASFGLFAPKNATVIGVLFLSGLAIAGGIFRIGARLGDRRPRANFDRAAVRRRKGAVARQRLSRLARRKPHAGPCACKPRSREPR